MIDTLKYKGELGYCVYFLFYRIYRYIKYNRFSDEKYLRMHFEKMQGYKLDLLNPKTLNEKIQWLKLYDRKKFYSNLADKFEVRKYIEKEFGSEYLIPLEFTSTDYMDLNPFNLPDFPFIIKTNHDSGNFLIVRDKQKINWKKVQTDFRFALSNNYYWIEREYQYFNIKPRILVEKLLVTKEGKIPNDYKLTVINGRVEFIYVSIDREGKNKRNIYSRNWDPLFFTWALKSKNLDNLRGPEIERPSSISKMIELAEKVGELFSYIRVDFYDVEGKIYFGEITQHHGGGFDQIRPIEFDYKYGEMIDLSKRFKYQ